MVGFAFGQAHGQTGRVPPVQEEGRCHRVVSAAQQTPQGKPAGHPRRRQRPAPVGHAARHRPVAVHDDTRRLRRMIAKSRAKILFATVSRHGGRWWIALNVEAADLHPDRQHPAR